MKKTSILASILTLTPFLALADSTSSIQLPDNFSAIIWTQAGQVFTGLQSYTTMIIGTILAVTIIGILIETLHKPGK